MQDAMEVCGLAWFGWSATTNSRTCAQAMQNAARVVQRTDCARRRPDTLHKTTHRHTPLYTGPHCTAHAGTRMHMLAGSYAWGKWGCLLTYFSHESEGSFHFVVVPPPPPPISTRLSVTLPPHPRGNIAKVTVPPPTPGEHKGHVTTSQSKTCKDYHRPQWGAHFYTKQSSMRRMCRALMLGI